MTDSSLNSSDDEEPDGEPDGESLAGGAEAVEPSKQPMSLAALKGAFAKMLGGAVEPPVAAGSDDPQSEEGERDSTSEMSDDSTDDDLPAADVTPEAILEAMLFVGAPDNEPLQAKRIAGFMRGVSTREIGQLVERLNEQYRADDAPFEIVSQADSYQMALRPEFERTREKFYGRVRQAKLSPAAVEVLSIVAYNQPTLRDEVNKIRGGNSGPLLTQLVRRQLLRIDRDEEQKRLVHYSTTDRFLRLFGLQSIEDLPRSEELLED